MTENTINGLFFVKRIDEALEKKEGKRAELLRDLKLPRNAITNWSDRGNIPAGDICLKIADYLGVSVEWLISGREGKLSAEQIKMVNALVVLNETQKETLFTLVDKWLADYAAIEKKNVTA